MTVAPIAPVALVAPQPRLPLPFGLFSLLGWRGNADRWESGVTWELGTCDVAQGIGQADCVNPEITDGMPKDFADDSPHVGVATPFTVYGHWLCSPIGTGFAEAQAKANDHLAAREEGRVEQSLWTGDLGNTPSLAEDPQVLAGGTAMPLPGGLALLEDYVAGEYGSLGVIHLTRGTALQASGAAALLEVRGSRLQTKVGTPVVAGGGYPGTGPVGSPANAEGTAWAYVSPPPFGYRSEVFTSSNRPGDLLDRNTNDLYAIAERNYLLGFDPCGVAAVLLDLSP